MLTHDARSLRRWVYQQLRRHHLCAWRLHIVSTLPGWCLGQCHYRQRRITILARLVGTPDRFRTVVLHEIAHALRAHLPFPRPVCLQGAGYQGARYQVCPPAGYQGGHDDTWRKIARQLGCTETELDHVYDALRGGRESVVESPGDAKPEEGNYAD